MLWCFFFFRQKTAYEMRISDWSSDVCSSDLREGDRFGQRRFRLAGPKPADRIDRALAIVARARERIGDRVMFVEQRGGVGEILVRNLVPRDRQLPGLTLLGAAARIREDHGQRDLTLAEIVADARATCLVRKTAV